MGNRFNHVCRFGSCAQYFTEVLHRKRSFQYSMILFQIEFCSFLWDQIERWLGVIMVVAVSLAVWLASPISGGDAKRGAEVDSKSQYICCFQQKIYTM